MQQTVFDSIRNGVEELAAKLLVQQNVAEARDSWAQSLLNLAAHAAACGNNEIQAIAAAAAARLEPDSELSDADAGSELERSIDALRALLSPQAQQSGTLPSIDDDPELIGDFVVESR